MIGIEALPLRVSIESHRDIEVARGGFPEEEISLATMKEVTATFTALIGGVLTEYIFKAVGPVELKQHIGELSDDDRVMLEEARRRVNELLGDPSQPVVIAASDLLAVLEASYYAGDDAPPLDPIPRWRSAQERAVELLEAAGVDVDAALGP